MLLFLKKKPTLSQKGVELNLESRCFGSPKLDFVFLSLEKNLLNLDFILLNLDSSLLNLDFSFLSFDFSFVRV